MRTLEIRLDNNDILTVMVDSDIKVSVSASTITNKLIKPGQGDIPSKVQATQDHGPLHIELDTSNYTMLLYGLQPCRKESNML